MQSTSERFSNKLVYVNYVLSVFIVITHTYCTDYANISNINSVQGVIARLFLDTFQGRICQIAVPAFFAISGYLFYRNFSLDGLLKKWKSRVKTLLIPYLLWNTTAFLFYYCISNVPVFHNLLSMEQVELSFETVCKGVFLHSFTVLWFVKVLMVFVIAAPIFYLLLKKQIISLIALGVFITIGIGFPHKSINSVLYTVAFYFLGAYLGTYHKNIVEKRQDIKTIMVTAFFMVVMLLLTNSGTNLSFYVFKLVWILGVWIIADLKKEYDSPKDFFKISFFMYCTHRFFIRIFEKIIWRIVPGGVFTNILLTITDTICAITISAFLIKKMTPKVWKLINGGRG